jgi:hypothetical protein
MNTAAFFHRSLNSKRFAHSTQKLVAVAMLAVVSGFASISNANSAPVVSGLKNVLDSGWALHPATDPTGIVIGYLAQQTTGVMAPNGYSIVWLERQTNGSFSMKGYDGFNLIDAARKVQASSSVAGVFVHTEFAELLYSTPLSSDAEPMFGFTVMSSGLAITDPLQPIASELPPEWMEALVENGALGATSLSASTVDHTIECVPTDKLNATLIMLTPDIEFILATDGVQVSQAVNAFFTCCFPWTRTTYFDTPSGPWISTNPTGATCNYSRPTTRNQITCTTSITCATTCVSVAVGPGTPRTGSCPGNPSGNCPVSTPTGCP